MDWKKLAEKAKQVVDKRGGTDSVKGDAQELKSIFEGDGTLAEKAKAAAAAIKEPGAGASAATSGVAAEEETAAVAGTDATETVQSDEES